MTKTLTLCDCCAQEIDTATHRWQPTLNITLSTLLAYNPLGAVERVSNQSGGTVQLAWNDLCPECANALGDGISKLIDARQCSDQPETE